MLGGITDESGFIAENIIIGSGLVREYNLIIPSLEPTWREKNIVYKV